MLVAALADLGVEAEALTLPLGEGEHVVLVEAYAAAIGNLGGSAFGEEGARAVALDPDAVGELGLARARPA